MAGRADRMTFRKAPGRPQPRKQGRARRGRVAAGGEAHVVESLETRILLSSDYLLNGNQLTVTTNGVAGSPTTVGNINSVTLTGDSGLNHFTIQNFAGHVTVDGQGGGDVITVYGGGGGTVTAHDTNPTSGNLDTLIVRAPTTQQANVTVNATRVTVGGDTVNYDNTVGAVSLIGQLFASGDALAVSGSASAEPITVTGSALSLGSGPTIYYSTFNGLTVNGGGGNDTLTIAGDSIPTTVNAGTGTVSFIVNGNAVPLILNGGAGADTFTINSSSGPLTVNGQAGDNSYIVNASSSGATLNGGSAANLYRVNGNSATLTINGAGTSNDVGINANSGTVAVNGNTGADTYTVNATTGQVTLHGGSGTTAYAVTAPTLAPVTVIGGAGGTGTLAFSGTPLRDVFSITGTTINAGTGAAVTYSNLNALTVNGVGGNDSFTVTGDTTPTTLNGATGNSTFNICSAAGLVTVNTGTGVSTVNVGGNEPSATGNTLAGITGGLTVVGDGGDTLNIDDSADTTARNGAVSATQVTGYSTGAITYSGLTALGLKLGTASDTVNVTASAAHTVTTINAGAGVNVFTVGSNAPGSGGVMGQLLGDVTLIGSGADALTLDDSGSAAAKTATLTPTTLTGLSAGTITYGGFTSLTAGLGTGGDNFTITDTAAPTVTTINGGSGADTLTVQADSSPTHLTTGGGADTVAIRANAAATTVVSAGNSAITVGSAAPATHGTLAGIQAGLTITGGGTDSLTLDDSADAVAAAGMLTPTKLTGMGMAAAGVTYGGISTLAVNLGAAGNTFTVANTNAATPTTVTGGAGADAIIVQNDAATTTIDSGTGPTTVNVQATGAVTNVNLVAAADVVNVGNNAPAGNSTSGTITGQVNVHGGGQGTLNVDDTGNPAARTVTLTAASLTGASPAAIDYTGISLLGITLGSGGNTVNVNGTLASVTTNLNTGAGDDTVNVTAMAVPTHITTGTGANSVTVGSNAPGSLGALGGITGALTVTGGGSDALTLDDGGDSLPRVGTLTATSLTGVGPTPIGFSGLASLVLNLGVSNDNLTVNDTIAGTTTVNAGSGNDTLTVLHDSGPTTLNGGPGADTFNLRATGAVTTIDTGSTGGANIINVGGTAPTAGGVLSGIAGEIHLAGDGSDTLNIDDSGDATGQVGNISATAVSGLSPAAIDYASVANLNVNLGDGGDTLTVTGTAAGQTTINGHSGADTFNIRAINSTTTVNSGTGANTVNVGSLAPASGGVLSGISAALTLNGGGSDILNFDDSGDAANTTESLSGNGLSGLTPTPITYGGAAAVNLALGFGNDALTVTNTEAGATTHVTTGTGTDTVTVVNDAGPTTIDAGSGADNVYIRRTGATTTVNHAAGAAGTILVGSNAPSAASTLSLIAAPLAINGNGLDVVSLDDTGNALTKTDTLSATTIGGLSPADIIYSHLANLNIDLGVGGDTFTVSDTAAGTATAVAGGAGAEQFNVRGTTGPLTLLTGGGTDRTRIGSLAPAGGGALDAIQGAVTVNGGSGRDQLSIDDTGSSTARTGTLSDTVLAIGPANITYAAIGALDLELGSAADTLTVSNTAAATHTTIHTGNGDNTITMLTDAGATDIRTGGGHNVVNIRGTGNLTSVTHADVLGGDLYNVGSIAPPSAACWTASWRRCRSSGTATTR